MLFRSAAVERMVLILPHLPAWPSGSFVDIHEIPDPEACAKLYRTSQGRRTPYGPYQTEEDWFVKEPRDQAPAQAAKKA